MKFQVLTGLYQKLPSTTESNWESGAVDSYPSYSRLIVVLSSVWKHTLVESLRFETRSETGTDSQLYHVPQ